MFARALAISETHSPDSTAKRWSELRTGEEALAALSDARDREMAAVNGSQAETPTARSANRFGNRLFLRSSCVLVAAGVVHRRSQKGYGYAQ